MRYLITILLAITIASCSQKETTDKNNRRLELYKQLALCSCIGQSARTFGVVDTSELYAGPVYTEIDAAGFVNSKIYKKLDSLIFLEVIKAQITAKANTDTQYVSEGARMRTSYTYSCLQFSQSERLKSTLKSLLEQ